MKPTMPAHADTLTLSRRIRESLDRCGYAALREIRCELGDGEVTLSGTVPTHFMKQIAAASVTKHVNGVRIHNRIRVVDRDLEPING